MAWMDVSLSLALNNLNPSSNPNPHKIPNKKEGGLAEELTRVSGENRKLTVMLTAMNQSYSALQTQLAQLTSSVAKRKKPVNSQGDQSSSSSDDESNVAKKPRDSSSCSCGGVITRKPSSRVLVLTDKSDTTLIVKDGYQWRKYGQKVTRDNPSPRAYFKCSFAPTCQVKKKVQRSAEDQTMLVATYDGEHNHLPPSEIEASSQRSSNLGPAMTNSVCSFPLRPMVTLDLIPPVEETRLSQPFSGVVDRQNRPVFQQCMAEQMASSLSNDPGFKAAVAAAISGSSMMDSKNAMIGKWL